MSSETAYEGLTKMKGLTGESHSFILDREMMNFTESVIRERIERTRIADEFPSSRNDEIHTLKQSELRLQKSNDKLERKGKDLTISLEKANSALRFMMKKEEELRSEYEDMIRCNIRQLVLSLVHKLKTTRLDSVQKKYVTLLELNLEEIISPFLLKMSKHFVDLTPTEIKIANLLKDGMCTKEIADNLCVSVRTIESHRSNIRKKLGIKYKNINTVSYLKSLEL